MPKKQHYIIAFIVSICITGIFLILHKEIFFPMGQNIVDSSGDGLKNLYTFGYYLNYDSGIRFTGLNYPFGEHITYMDAQPLYVWIIWLIEKVIPHSYVNPIMCIHVIIIINIFVGSFFIFLILIKFGAEVFFSIIGTIIIILLSPQLYRFGDHFALASIGVIPLFWWYYINLKNRIWVFVIALSLVGYIHPYLLIMLNMLFLSYELFYIFINKKVNYKNLLIPLSVVIYILSLKLLDPINDRPNSAWGAKAFSAKPQELLLPLNGFVKEFFNNVGLNLPTTYTEGHAYVTIFGLFIIVYTLYIIIKRKFVIQKIKINSPEHWLIASLPILMFAFYIPFRWNESLFEPINIFKQFRGTGRFVAVFYYVYLIYTFYAFNILYKKHKRMLTILLILFLPITAYDIYNASQYNLSRYHIFGRENALDVYKAFTNDITKNIPNIKKYECIIVYPPSTEGTEKIWIDNDWNAKIYSFWFSYITGLPMANVHSSRVSFKQAMDIFQLSGFYNIEKNIAQKFDKKKSSLVMLQNERLNDNIPLIKMATFIDSSNGMSLLAIQPHDLVNEDILNLNNSWVDTNAYKLIGENNFSKIKSGTSEIKEDTEVLRIKFLDEKNKKIRILFWYKPNNGNKISVPICSIYNVDNGEKKFIKDWRECHTNTYNFENDFLCVDYELEINNVKDILITMSGNDIIIDKISVYKKYL